MESTVYQEEYNEIDFVDLLRILWNGKKLIIAFSTGAIILAVLYLNFLVVYLFETEATIQLTSIPGLYSNTDYVSRLLQSEIYLNPVIEKLKLAPKEADSYQDIKDKIEVKKVEKTNMITVKVKNQDPELAYQINREIIARYQEESDKLYQAFIHEKNEYLESLQERLIEIESKIIMLEEQIQQLFKQNNQPDNIFYLSGVTELLDSYYQTKIDLQGSKQDINVELKSYYPVNILDTPYLPDSPVSPNKYLIVVIAAFLGLFGGVFFVFLLDYVKQHKKEITDQAS